MEVVNSDFLNGIALVKKYEDAKKIADVFFEQQDEDPFECDTVFTAGIENGLKLALKLDSFKLFHPEFLEENVKVFSVFFEWAENEDDGSDSGEATCFFVGTLESVAKKLQALPNNEDSDEDDSEDD